MKVLCPAAALQAAFKALAPIIPSNPHTLVYQNALLVADQYGTFLTGSDGSHAVRAQVVGASALVAGDALIPYHRLAPGIQAAQGDITLQADSRKCEVTFEDTELTFPGGGLTSAFPTITEQPEAMKIVAPGWAIIGALKAVLFAADPVEGATLNALQIVPDPEHDWATACAAENRRAATFRFSISEIVRNDQFPRVLLSLASAKAIVSALGPVKAQDITLTLTARYSKLQAGAITLWCAIPAVRPINLLNLPTGELLSLTLPKEGLLRAVRVVASACEEGSTMITMQRSQGYLHLRSRSSSGQASTVLEAPGEGEFILPVSHELLQQSLNNLDDSVTLSANPGTSTKLFLDSEQARHFIAAGGAEKIIPAEGAWQPPDDTTETSTS